MPMECTIIMQCSVFLLLLCGTTVQTNLITENEDTLLTNVTMDDEELQDQEHYIRYFHCNYTLLPILYDQFILQPFGEHMANLTEESWCDWSKVIGPYNNISITMEYVTTAFGCFYPNPAVHDCYVQIHRQYFQHCTPLAETLVVPPDGVTAALVLLPISLMSIFVYLAACKNKVQE